MLFAPALSDEIPAGQFRLSFDLKTGRKPIRLPSPAQRAGYSIANLPQGQRPGQRNWRSLKATIEVAKSG